MAIPKYAQNIPALKRVHILCRGRCRKGRYAEAKFTRYEAQQLSDILREQKATCAYCGYIASDSYNWGWK